jgi:NADH-quinone oxidoreductase subunit L
VSQLGLMFVAMGAGAYAAGIFHLYTHAFFKALLFLGSGAVIHALAGEQDIRRMGGLRKELPVTYWTFLIGTLAIAGVPFLSGFFSKDELLYRTYASGHTVVWFFASAASLLTACYMFRLVFLTFHGERANGAGVPPADRARGAAHGGHDAHGGHAAHGHLHDAPRPMAIALVVLAVGAVLAGYVGVPAVLGGSNRIEHFLEPSFTVAVESAGGAGHDAAPAGGPSAARLETAGAAAAEGHGDAGGAHGAELEGTLMGISTVVAFTGIGLAWLFFVRRRDLADAVAARFPGLHRLLLRKYYVDEIYDAGLVQPVRIVSEQALWKGIDVGVIDGAVNGAGVTVRGASAWLRLIQTGSIRAYAASLMLGALVIIGYMLWPK